MSGKLILLIALVFGVLAPAIGAWAQQNRRDGPPAAAPRAVAPRAPTQRDGTPYSAPRGYYGGYAPPPGYGGPAYPGPYGSPRPGPAPYGYAVGAPRGAPPTDWRLQQEEARSGVRSGQFAPLGRVIAGIRERTPGRQLDTGLEYQGGRAVYRVRWITARGRRVDFLVDAASGAILGER